MQVVYNKVIYEITFQFSCLKTQLETRHSNEYMSYELKKSFSMGLLVNLRKQTFICNSKSKNFINQLLYSG